MKATSRCFRDNDLKSVMTFSAIGANECVWGVSEVSKNGATTVHSTADATGAVNASNAGPASQAISPNGIEHTLANGRVAIPQSSRKTVSTICSARIVGARAARIWCIGSGSITI